MSPEKVHSAIEILMVEDNPADVRLTQEALRDAKVQVNMNVVEDGNEAMAYLRREGKYKDSVQPDIMLLDLNLPGKDGREVLAEMKADPALKHIPVVVLTTSRAEEDICRVYNLQAACYVTKPVDFDEFVKVVRAIEGFWLTVVKFPSEVCGR
jgi:two-component system response regulator